MKINFFEKPLPTINFLPLSDAADLVAMTRGAVQPVAGDDVGRLCRFCYRPGIVADTEYVFCGAHVPTDYLNEME